MTKIYRAVPRADLLDNAVLTRLPTTRVPVNVPYLVDNIWEYLRPAHAPSRRHAIYASPSAEQALASASKGEDIVVCELVIKDVEYRVAQLSVVDAKLHKDIRNIMRVASRLFAQLFDGMSEQDKLVYAPLFMPGATANLTAAVLRRRELADLLEVANASSMWLEARYVVTPNHDGELFFELSAQGEASLVALELNALP